MKNLKVGFAQVDFTPDKLPLVGNFRDDYISRGTHDPLCSHAIVFANSSQKIALLSIDLCLLRRDNVALMRNYITSKCDINPENILISATHTHAGSLTFQRPGYPKVHEKIIDAFLKKAASAVVQANQNLKDTTLYIGHNQENRISFNRRLKCKDGKIHPNWEVLKPDFIIGPTAPIDPQVITLSVSQNSKLKAALVNFALHPAILAGDNWLYSADFPGYLVEAMEKLFGDEFMTAFFNGCCGNINHIDYTDSIQGRGYMMTQRVGYMLAVAAQQAMQNHTAIHGNEIAVSHEMLTLPRMKISKELRQWCEEVLKKAKSNPASSQVDGLPDENYALKGLDMYKLQNKDDVVEVMAMRIGDLGIVGLPGEIFCELGMEIKKSSPAKHTIVIELANDAILYLPTCKAFEEGGYGADIGTTKYEKGAGDKLVASALNQLNKLFPAAKKQRNTQNKYSTPEGI